MTEFFTAGGKELQIITDPQTAHIKVQFKEGGQLPEELSGLFTSKAIAEIAIQSYLLNNTETKKTKSKKFIDSITKTLED
jgi:hypothetical protein